MVRATLRKYLGAAIGPGWSATGPPPNDAQLLELPHVGQVIFACTLKEVDIHTSRRNAAGWELNVSSSDGNEHGVARVLNRRVYGCAS